ncbi:MAG: CooT family nickel-binding protein [Anaerolineales bacterium]|jgi:predicted RNA-binding protein
MMCQATVYLNGEVIMRDVLMVEPIPEGIRLIALFEPVQVVPAAIRQIDLIKHRVILESFQESDERLERSGETVGGESV